MPASGPEPQPPTEDEVEGAERAVAEAPETVPDAYQQAVEDEA